MHRAEGWVEPVFPDSLLPSIGRKHIKIQNMQAECIAHFEVSKPISETLEEKEHVRRNPDPVTDILTGDYYLSTPR